MFCNKCGNSLEPNQQFCGNCGSKPISEFDSIKNSQNKKINNKIKITTITLVLLIILTSAVIGVVILKGNKTVNIFNSKYVINVSYDEKGNINLDDAISKTYYYPDSSSFAGQEKIVDVYKINDYVSVIENAGIITNHLEFSSYDETKDKEHKLGISGHLSDNIEKINVITNSEKRVYTMDFDYDEERIKDITRKMSDEQTGDNLDIDRVRVSQKERDRQTKSFFKKAMEGE